MSTLTADLRTAKSTAPPPMEAVVVNSIIYSKPSFCTIAADLGDVPSTSDNKSETLSKPKSENYLNNGKFQNEMEIKNPCWTNLSMPPPPAGAKVYRMCTTINGSIHHQISDFCDNILAMAGFLNAAKNDHDDDSLIDFGYRDDLNFGLGGDLDSDDDDEDCVEDEDEDGNLDGVYDDDDDNDVVDFSYECPIEPVPKFNCDKKKKVHFNTKPTVHYMHTWSYAYRAARKGEWEMYARDRDRFKLRTQRAALILNPILDREHRQKIYEKRFVNIYSNDEDSANIKQRQEETTESKTNEAANVEDPVESAMKNKDMSNDTKKPHQKKKRRKKRFCKMGNKQYF